MPSRHSQLHKFSFVFALLFSGLLSSAATGQSARQTDVKAPVKVTSRAEKKLKVEIKQEPFITISLTGEEVVLPEITTALTQKLGLPITVSPALKTQLLTLDIIGYSLEQTLRLLAPRPFVDSIVSGDAALSPKYLAVHLHNFQELPPEPQAHPNAAPSGAEGSFEVDEKTDEREASQRPVQVRYERGKLSVQARDQALLTVLTAVAIKMNVVCEIQGSANGNVNVSFSDYSLAQAVQALSPRVQFYLRTNLQTGDTVLWRMVLAPQSVS